MCTNIILIGFMGTGKTTISHRIQQMLPQFQCLDMDELIVERNGLTITEIFEERGEDYFRSLETNLLHEFVGDGSTRPLILSTGGGVVLRAENRALLKQIGKVFWLEASPESIYHRLAEDTTRPLLQGNRSVEQITSMLNSRSSYYQEASDHRIQTDDREIDSICEEILRYAKKILS